MNEHTCLKEHEWGELSTTMKNIEKNLSEWVKRTELHINEGERPGGVRNRVDKLEWDVSELKKRFWWSAIVGGVIGALIGSGSGDLLRMFITWIMRL